ncbi:hypothetical protein PILCRDRAFT_513162 [Piloderma croceum F 1598]|uniref:Uncharacterized protein n=1 Tax=Piloderma croceum (strain F 1598) TaxID=765440 RepID=A0A0C3FN77_PILCF|nr:hypothetical protein PILCRDRAFT_513162 [Piloderma croceum F 1598]
MATLITMDHCLHTRYPLFLLPPFLLSFFSCLSRVDSRPFNLSFTSGSPSLIEIPLRNSQEEFY